MPFDLRDARIVAIGPRPYAATRQDVHRECLYPRRNRPFGRARSNRRSRPKADPRHQLHGFRMMPRWTGCPSQLRGCGRKSLICIRPVARLAGRGLDGNTHAPLISLRDRLLTSHQGHQIQGASIDPFHAGPQSRIRSRRSAKSPWPRGVYRRPCRSAGRSRRSGRACWLTRRRACFCATAPTPF